MGCEMVGPVGKDSDYSLGLGGSKHRNINNRPHAPTARVKPVNKRMRFRVPTKLWQTGSQALTGEPGVGCRTGTDLRGGISAPSNTFNVVLMFNGNRRAGSHSGEFCLTR